VVIHKKVQRYALEWAKALRNMSELGAEVMLPGHGPSVKGKDVVKKYLCDTAELLEYLHNKTVELMNKGIPLNEILCTIKVPPHLQTQQFLQPIYDEPEFIIRNIWRLYGGWYDGNPANLKPGSNSDLAKEIVRLIGGIDKLIERAIELQKQKNFILACHIIEYAFQADPTNVKVNTLRSSIYMERAEHETSLMAKGIYKSASKVSDKKIKKQSKL